MTVVCWDGKTLAADKRGCIQGHVYTLTKIVRIGGLLVGGSGHMGKVQEFQTWVRDGMDPEKFPKRTTDEEWYSAITIDRQGVVRRYEGSPFPITVEDSNHAIGTGRDFARAAMHLGKTAREAVELTCLFSADCGNGIDTLSFDEA